MNGIFRESRDATFITDKTVSDLGGELNFEPDANDFYEPEESDYATTYVSDQVVEDQLPVPERYSHQLPESEQDATEPDDVFTPQEEEQAHEEERSPSPEQTHRSLGRQLMDISTGKVPLLDPAKRPRKPPQRFSNAALIIPKTYKQALKSDDEEYWSKAMEEELASIANHDVWDVVPIPRKTPIIGTRWVFTTKTDGMGNIERYKARLVAQGFRQIAAPEDVHSPVVSAGSKMIALTLATLLNLSSCHVDVKTAFLHGKVDEDIYLRPPPQMEQGVALKLKRALYGLRQSPKLWWNCVFDALTKIGFRSCRTDSCFFIKGEKSNLQMITVHVDDFGIFGSDEQIKSVINHLETEFDIKILGAVTNYLGVSIVRRDDTTFISQPDKIMELLAKFQMSNCTSVSTPMDSGVVLCAATDEEQLAAKDLPYRSIVGSLNHLAKTSRPDISATVSMLSTFNHSYGKTHFIAAKRVLRYLKGTMYHGVSLAPKDFSLTAFSDSDYAGDTMGRRSRTGYCIFLGGALVSWKSNLQKTVSRSTMEAEYRALADCVQEVKTLRSTLDDLGFGQTEPTIINEDNQPCIAIVTNPHFKARARHIEVDYHYCSEAIVNKICKIVYCPTADMKADGLTKPLGKVKHLISMDHLCVCPPPGGEE